MPLVSFLLGPMFGIIGISAIRMKKVVRGYSFLRRRMNVKFVGAPAVYFGWLCVTISAVLLLTGMIGTVFDWPGWIAKVQEWTLYSFGAGYVSGLFADRWVCNRRK